VATADLEDTALIVNFHPMVDEAFRAKIRERATQAADCGHVSFREESAKALLGEVDVLLYNSSSTSFEAAAAGVPAIFVASDIGLDLDPMSGQGAARCRAAGELRKSLVRLLHDEELRRANVTVSQAHLRRCFAAASEPAWLALAQDVGAGRC
jgi:CDP-glycerol glycerophosphotransferase (TagB/SpsB family)